MKLNNIKEYFMREHLKEKATDEILLVKKFFRDRDENEILLKCPHCESLRSIEGDLEDEDDFEGSQFEDNLCGGTYEIDENPIFIKNIDDL